MKAHKSPPKLTLFQFLFNDSIKNSFSYTSEALEKTFLPGFFYLFVHLPTKHSKIGEKL